MPDLGFKKLTKENWLRPDRISDAFLIIPNETQDQKNKKGEIYLEMILKPSLSDNVPIEVRKMFEVARGALVYGYFFYPLFTLACEQLFRVGEAAITIRCDRINTRASSRRFEKKIDFLFANGVLNEQEKQLWHALRTLRNISSHPKDQSIYTPGQVIQTMNRIVEDINELFIC